MNKHNNLKTVKEARNMRYLVQEAIARQGLGLPLTIEQKRALLKQRTIKAVRSYA